MEKQLVSTEELCSSLNISKGTLDKLKKEGLPFVEITQKNHKYNLNEVYKFLSNKR